MSKPLRVIFMGSPAFAVPSLTRLLADGHTLALVVTQPDRPAGRGQDLRPPPVKRAAERHGLRILQPEKLNDPDVQATLAAAQPDVIAVAAFGQFLPRAVRELPPLGCVNVHASLLPKYRGAAPINWALIAGETETGITIMRIEEGMDAGPTLLQRAIPIAPEDDAGTLHDRLADLGAAALADALALVARGEAVWTSQDDARATKAPKIRDEDCRLELAGDPGPLVNRIRGLSPAPGAYLTWRGQR
ncbi:MAG: methionyl-tRNA formyltransferase, partial [candidate division NC10 bacterium]|nr:methionyl-tRNA formyltransferase [candidate division NC10 bacterium]MBI2117098.1 methionyl-tRNA formyltransferase [candidate division NC10 bacterium]